MQSFVSKLLTPLLLGTALLVATSACGAPPAARHPEAGELEAPGWVRVDTPVTIQRGLTDCGAAVLTSLLQYWGKPTSVQSVRDAVGRGALGRASAAELRDFAQSTGLEAFVFYAQFDTLRHELDRGRPVIVGLHQPVGKQVVKHYELVNGYNAERELVTAMDPATGLVVMPLAEFMKRWQAASGLVLVAFAAE